MLISELVPERVEVLVVVVVNDVAQLMKHSINDMLQREELRCI